MINSWYDNVKYFIFIWICRLLAYRNLLSRFLFLDLYDIDFTFHIKPHKMILTSQIISFCDSCLNSNNNKVLLTCVNFIHSLGFFYIYIYFFWVGSVWVTT